MIYLPELLRNYQIEARLMASYGFNQLSLIRITQPDVGQVLIRPLVRILQAQVHIIVNVVHHLVQVLPHQILRPFINTLAKRIINPTTKLAHR